MALLPILIYHFFPTSFSLKTSDLYSFPTSFSLIPSERALLPILLLSHFFLLNFSLQLDLLPILLSQSLSRVNHVNQLQRKRVEVFSLCFSSFFSTLKQCLNFSFQVLREFGDSLIFSWLDKGVLSPVRDQGSCCSCWTMSTTGAIESRFLISLGLGKNELPEVQLSTQKVLNCVEVKLGVKGSPEDEEERKNGCYEARFDYVFTYSEWYGIYLEKDCPYVGKKGKCGCGFFEAVKFFSKGICDYTMGNLLEGIRINPIACGIFFPKKKLAEFKKYEDGIFEGNTREEIYKLQALTLRKGNKRRFVFGHGLLIVGFGLEIEKVYGLEFEKKFLLVKNSWGESWGVNGFGKISMTCFLSQMKFPVSVTRKFKERK